MSTGETGRFAEGGVLLVKANDDAELATAADVDANVSCAVLLHSPMKSLLASVEHVFEPVLSASISQWSGKLTEDQSADLFTAIQRYTAILSDAVNGVEATVELQEPSRLAQFLESEQRQGRPNENRAPPPTEVVESFPEGFDVGVYSGP